MSVGDEEKRESAGCTLGISFGLFVLLLLALAPCQMLRGKSLSAEEEAELLRANFVEGKPPRGFSVAEASEIQGGDRMLRLERNGAGDGAGSDVLFGSGPDELVLVLPAKIASVERLFDLDLKTGEDASEMMSEWREDPEEGWNTPLDGGDLHWDGWSADFLMQRSFREGGGFRDGAVVNLSLPGRPRALMVLWRAGEEASKEELLEVVRQVSLTEGE